MFFLCIHTRMGLQSDCRCFIIMWLVNDGIQAHSWCCGIHLCSTCRHTLKMSLCIVSCCSAHCLMCWYVSELNAVSWHCFIGSCWKELIAVVVLNIVFFMVRQSLTPREFNSCQNTLNTCMLTSSQVKILSLIWEMCFLSNHFVILDMFLMLFKVLFSYYLTLEWNFIM